MTPEQALQSIQSALDSNNFTAPKQIHVQLQECIKIIQIEIKKNELNSLGQSEPDKSS